ncbi:hypothetical protein ACTFIT_006119 [Dictyostelium discoideum]
MLYKSISSLGNVKSSQNNFKSVNQLSNQTQHSGNNVQTNTNPHLIDLSANILESISSLGNVKSSKRSFKSLNQMSNQTQQSGNKVQTNTDSHLINLYPWY